MSSTLKTLCEEADRLDLHGLSRELTLRQLESRPDDWRLLLDLAVHEMTFSRYEEAQAAIDHAERVCPPRAMKWVLSRRGERCNCMGEFDAAIRYYLAAHELDPEEATFLIYAGGTASSAGDNSRALEFATRATQCSTGCLEEAWFNRGGCFMAMRRFSEARDCYLKALEIDPFYALARKRLDDVTRILALDAECAAEPPPGRTK